MLKSKRFNMILALIAAIALWAYVLGEINPTSSTVVRNVPINFINEETLEAEGLTMLSSSDMEVSVTISGKRTSITRADEGDFKVTADVEALKKGENTVRLNVTGPSDVKIERMNLEKITVIVDEKISQEKPVEVVFNGEIGSDREASAVEIDRETIRVTGAETLVNQVESLAAYVDASKLTSDMKEFKTDVVPVNKRGEAVQGLAPEAVEGGTKVSVKAVMLDKKTVELNVPVENLSSDKVEREFEAPKTVVVKGTRQNLERIDSITCRRVDLGDILTDSRITLEPILPEGVELADSSSELVMQVTVREMESKTFKFSNEAVTVIGKESGRSYSVSAADFEVTVRGTAEAVKELSAEDFSLEADASGLTAGKHNVKINVKCSREALTAEIRPGTVEIIIE